MADVIHDAVDYVPPLVVEEEELYHAKTWLGKYAVSYTHLTLPTILRV